MAGRKKDMITHLAKYSQSLMPQQAPGRPIGMTGITSRLAKRPAGCVAYRGRPPNVRPAPAARALYPPENAQPQTAIKPINDEGLNHNGSDDDGRENQTPDGTDRSRPWPPIRSFR